MQNADSECVQNFNIENDCASMVNPLYFTSYLQVEKGRATSSKEVAVTLKSAYTFNQDTLSYT